MTHQMTTVPTPQPRPKTWKLWLHVLGYFSCFVLGGTSALLPLSLMPEGTNHGQEQIVAEPFRLLVTLVLLLLYTRFILRDAGMNQRVLRSKRKQLQPWQWILIGLALPFLLIGAMLLFGHLHLGPVNTQVPVSLLVLGMLSSAAMALASGITEEVVFRGYMVSLLAQRYRTWIAVLAPALVFALLHLPAAKGWLNMGQVLGGGILVSFMFYAFYNRSGSIWAAATIHGLWNFIILNRALSFDPPAEDGVHRLVHLLPAGPDYLTGGKFGIEVSLYALLLYLAVILVLSTRKK